MNRALLTVLLTIGLVAIASDVHAEAFVRVIAQKASVKSGPSGGYREVFVAQRGQVFEVLERGTRDFWYKVELEDGTAGWILGDLVFPFEVGPEEEPGIFSRMGGAIRRTILGPSPLPYANVGLSFSAGILDREGVFFLRPSWIVDPYWAIELHAGLNPRSEKDLFLAGLGFILRMIPGAVVGPYAGLSLGAAYIRPKADNPIDKEETVMALGAGGGLEITFKKQITVRLDARNWTFFDQNKASNGQEFTSGLAIFF
ncbi:MAG: SH3 domain-containing protein [Proteobacteria bacterium]|nr:SH3 domain-containing protein [Pseudomonadota bacterium]